MIDDAIYKSKLQISGFDIQVSIVQDDLFGLLDNTDMAEEVTQRDLPHPVKESLDYHGATWAVDNWSHEVYVKASAGNDDFYFTLRETLKEAQQVYIDYHKEKGEEVNRHTAWVKALSQAKKDADYICGFYNDDWYYVGIEVEITATMTDENGLIWSKEVDNNYDLWGIDWNSHLESGENSIINNELTFKDILPDLLPNYIKLDDTQLHELWLNLE